MVTSNSLPAQFPGLYLTGSIGKFAQHKIHLAVDANHGWLKFWPTCAGVVSAQGPRFF